MIAILFVFWMFVALFSVVGAMRGWAKELLVSFSIVLAIFIITVLERFVPFVAIFLEQSDPTVKFWVRSILILLFAFFGYQTPNLPRVASARFARERLQDTVMGFLLGGVNGFLIVGTLWFYLHEANYFPPFIYAPDANNEFGKAALDFINLLPPRWLGVPAVYFAIAIAFAFVVIVFI